MMKPLKLDCIEQSFINTIKKHNMLDAGDKVLVGLSGGSDSVCLMLLLIKYADYFGISVAAAHINHCIRGKQADEDESFVRQLCKDRNIELYVLKKDIPRLANENGMSLEECARNVRYDFFDVISNKYAINKIAVAHNASDCSETLIFNISRGCGLSGMKGIQPKRNNIIRPLINCTKNQIQEYCNNSNIIYKTDKTNFDTNYSRNFIRAKVLPPIRQLSPMFDFSVRKLCESVCEDDEYMFNEAKEFIKLNLSSGYIDSVAFNSLHPSIAKRVIMLLFSEVSVNNIHKMLESKHITSAIDFIKKNSSGKYLNMPDNVILLCEYGKFCFKEKSEITNNCILYLNNGNNEFNRYNINVYMFERNSHNAPKIIHTLLKQAFIDCDKISGEVYVRTRKNGDKIIAEHMTKSVKEFFINKKIPTSERNSYPIICDDSGIIWVPSLSVADRVKIDNESKKIMFIKIKEV